MGMVEECSSGEITVPISSDGYDVYLDGELSDVQNLRFRYDGGLEPVIEFASTRGARSMLWPSFSSLRMSSRSCKASFDAILLSQVYKSDEDFVKFLARPTLEPAAVVNRSHAVSMEADIVNGLDLHFQGHQLKCEWSGWKISYRELDHTKDLRRSRADMRPEAHVTGHAVVEKSDGSAFSSDDGWRVVHKFSEFLTFARGSGVGVGNLRGLGETGEVAFSLFGFSKFDTFHGQRGWFDITSVKDLPEATIKFMNASSSKEDGMAIRRALDFYRVSNAIRKTTAEVSLVSAYSGVEVLVHHVLRTRGGWSKGILNAKATVFHDKFRAALALTGAKLELFEQSPCLQTRLKSFSDKDAFELVSMFRNAAVHQEQRLDYTGRELFEAWQILQWCNELLTFFLIGYRGIMSDRRRYSGWRGEGAGPVPLP